LSYEGCLYFTSAGYHFQKPSSSASAESENPEGIPLGPAVCWLAD